MTMDPDWTSAVIISEQAELEKLTAELEQCGCLAVDTESDSFYAYRPKVCLLQISTAAGDFIIDPLALSDLAPLAPIFANPNIEKVFHAADNDLIALRRDFGFQVRTLFDTAIAYSLLGHRHLALAKILAAEFQVILPKKWQRCNWAKRPLQPEQIHYASLDTHYLIPLRRHLGQRLEEKGLAAAAQQRFARLEKLAVPKNKPWNPEGYRHLRGADKLSPQELTVLRVLYRYREKLARQTNTAPFRILTNDTLVRLARLQPRDRQSLRSLPGLPARFKGKGGARLLELIKKAQS